MAEPGPEAERLVLVERVGDGVAQVTLNRPQAMNALSRDLRQAFAAAMRALDEDEETRAVILTGAGSRAFCAGLDLKELGSHDGVLEDVEDDPALAVSSCRKPVVGAVNGVAITGGLEVALACDILVASSTARFADTHARVGVMPGWGLSQKLPRLIGVGRAKEMSFTGNFVDADTAERWGLVNRVVAPDALIPIARALAADMASADPAMVARLKALIDDGQRLPLGEALDLERQVSASHNGGIGPGDVEARRTTLLARGRRQ